ncbi:MAG: hypothetical protein H6732_16575, partial [Alphaproteobacteria bacterium]|nr:hypothetical protein [Alphaproteobacteria bacterium]
AVAVLWGAWSLYEARLDARLRAQVAEAGLADHVAWDDLDLMPFGRGVALDGVRLSPTPGHPLLSAARAACDELALDDGYLTSLRCSADGGEVDLDAGLDLLGVPGSFGGWGTARVDAASGWRLDDAQRRAHLDGRLHAPDAVVAGCDLEVEGIDLEVLRALHAAAEAVRAADPWVEPGAWVAAVDEALGTGSTVLGGLAVRVAGCELTDDGLVARLRADPRTATTLRSGLQLGLMLVDPGAPDAVARFFADGGTLRVGTRVDVPIAIFSTATGVLMPGPLALAPFRSTGFGLTYRAPAP